MADDMRPDLLELTAMVVANFVGNNTASAAEVPELIRSVFQTFSEAGAGVPRLAAAVADAEPLRGPAVAIAKSITPDYLISLEDGQKYRALKRHLRAKYDLSPEEYRAKWGLPKDYPMVAPNYSAKRSALAREIGLGKGSRGFRPRVAAPPSRVGGPSS